MKTNNKAAIVRDAQSMVADCRDDKTVEIVMGYRTETEADDAIRAYGLQGAIPEFFELFDEWNILLANGLLLTERPEAMTKGATR